MKKKDTTAQHNRNQNTLPIPSLCTGGQNPCRQKKFLQINTTNTLSNERPFIIVSFALFNHYWDRLISIQYIFRWNTGYDFVNKRTNPALI